jgi:tRNA A-37 threonylcarbamoyl transferase component Bud32
VGRSPETGAPPSYTSPVHSWVLPAGLDLRLRVASAELLGLPWLEPLGEWDATEVAIRDIPVGHSRHLVRFVEADGRLWALKELPQAIARREYRVLRELEDLALSAVRTAGVVVQPAEDTAILVTHYLEASWQYRRLLMRVPIGNRAHRARLFDAIAALLVDLHRNGVFWGDCSLSNTLFMRDGQIIRAWLVDAETAQLVPKLSDGQRNLDLEIMVENVLGGLLDVAARLELPEEAFDQLVTEAQGVVDRYQKLWAILHEEPVIGLDEGYHVEARVRRLNELGFAVDEVRLESSESGGERARLKIAVAGRTFHSDQLQALTGMEVGEGQATILLNDLRAHVRRLQRDLGYDVGEAVGAQLWLQNVFTPGVAQAHEAVGGVGDPIQAYCDLLEVRWLLSEEAGTDVGDGAALEALVGQTVPRESAANIAFVDVATRELPVIPPAIEQAGTPVTEREDAV